MIVCIFYFKIILLNIEFKNICKNSLRINCLKSNVFLNGEKICENLIWRVVVMSNCGYWCNLFKFVVFFR